MNLEMMNLNNECECDTMTYLKCNVTVYMEKMRQKKLTKLQSVNESYFETRLDCYVMAFTCMAPGA